MSRLLEPFSFRNGRSAANRVVLAAMTNRQSDPDGRLSGVELAWLALRAEGGFGVITTCASHVAKDGQGWPGELGCFDDTHIPGLRQLAEMTRTNRAVSLLQIFHAGMRADEAVSGAQPYSASADGRVREASQADLERVVQQFADAAARADAAGMDGVEIHGAHGYLLTQFLSRTQNRRCDAWGGSLENRARLVRVVAKAVRARVPAKHIVGVRLSPEDAGNAQGLDLDESLQVAAWLADDGVDFVHVSLPSALQSSKKRPLEQTVSLFRSALPSEVPVWVAGKIWTADEGEAALRAGADAIALARAAVANPDWPRRVASGEAPPRMPPLSPDELRVRGVSPAFVDYLRNWRDFVSP